MVQGVGCRRHGIRTGMNLALARGLEREDQGRAYRVLDRLYQVVHTVPTVAYYEELNQDIEHVAEFAVRSAYSSDATAAAPHCPIPTFATSQWKTLDARGPPVGGSGPVSELERFRLKADADGHRQCGISGSVEHGPGNWQKIRDALIETSTPTTFARRIAYYVNDASIPTAAMRRPRRSDGSIPSGIWGTPLDPGLREGSRSPATA